MIHTMTERLMSYARMARILSVAPGGEGNALSFSDLEPRLNFKGEQ